MVEHTIRYRFTCETCKQDSGWQQYRFVEDVQEHDSPVAWAAHAGTFGASDAMLSRAELAFAIKQAKAAFERGDYWNKLNGACPHCGQVQSWYQAPTMRTAWQLFWGVVLRVCLWQIPALIVTLILFLIFEAYEVVVLVPGLTLVLSLFFGIKNGVKELRENRAVFKPALTRPEIDWNEG